MHHVTRFPYIMIKVRIPILAPLLLILIPELWLKDPLWVHWSEFRSQENDQKRRITWVFHNTMTIEPGFHAELLSTGRTGDRGVGFRGGWFTCREQNEQLRYQMERPGFQILDLLEGDVKTASAGFSVRVWVRSSDSSLMTTCGGSVSVRSNLQWDNFKANKGLPEDEKPKYYLSEWLMGWVEPFNLEGWTGEACCCRLTNKSCCSTTNSDTVCWT